MQLDCLTSFLRRVSNICVQSALPDKEQRNANVTRREDKNFKYEEVFLRLIREEK